MKKNFLEILKKLFAQKTLKNSKKLFCQKNFKKLFDHKSIKKFKKMICKKIFQKFLKKWKIILQKIFFEISGCVNS